MTLFFSITSALTVLGTQSTFRTGDHTYKLPTHGGYTYSPLMYNLNSKHFIESSESVTNFPYFIMESTYSGKILPRKFLVIDESHNAESELSKFIEVKTTFLSILTLPIEVFNHTTLQRGLMFVKSHFSFF